jgi:opacity protein-like surface antigen
MQGGGLRCAALKAGIIAIAMGSLIAPARAQSIMPTTYSSYVGLGGNVVHHTGYMPNSSYNEEMWTPGAKLFAGYRVNDWMALEATYHYLGTSHFDESVGVRARETSQSFSASVVFRTQPISRWVGSTLVPTRLLARLGLARKLIHQTSIIQTNTEFTTAAVVGFGVEFDITDRIFIRAEYEYISTAIGGPLQRVPGLAGLYYVTIGGTYRVVNAMHTPLSISVGWRF